MRKTSKRAGEMIVKDIRPAQDKVIGRAAWGEATGKLRKTALDGFDQILSCEDVAVQIIGMLGQCSPRG